MSLRLRQIYLLARRYPSERILDIGCGDGAFALRLREACSAERALRRRHKVRRRRSWPVVEESRRLLSMWEARRFPTRTRLLTSSLPARSSSTSSIPIVGDGPEQALLEGLSRGQHNVHLIPQRIQHEELPLLYMGASLYLASSLVEPLNFTIAEAMACGTPALVSDAGGLPDLVGNCRLDTP